MNDNLEKSYIELLDRIKADARSKESILPGLISHFLPIIPKQKSSIKNRVMNLLSFNQKDVKIKTIDDLLHELEGNNIISKMVVAPLDLVVDKLDSDILRLFLVKHKELVESEQTSTNSAADNTQQLQRLSEEVRQTVCRGISKRWLDLGRQLCVPDETLDQIELKYEDSERRAAKVLELFEKSSLYEERDARLYNALVAAKRKDLADKILPMLEENVI